MKILVISACTNKKKNRSSPAHELYLGKSHQYVRQGIEKARENHKVRHYIYSALHGIVDEHTFLEPYDYTYKGKKKEQKEKRACTNGAHSTFRQIMAVKSLDMTIITLPRDYLDSLQLSPVMECNHPVICICNTVTKLPYKMIPIRMKEKDCKKFKAGKINLGGKITQHILENIKDMKCFNIQKIKEIIE